VSWRPKEKGSRWDGASGHARWLERLLAELNIEFGSGTPPKFAEARTQAEDGPPGCTNILRLLLKDDFPRSGYRVGRIAICDNCCGTDTAWCVARTRMMKPVASGGPERRSPLQEETVAGSGRKTVEAFRLAPWASRRRQDLLELLDRLNPMIAALSQAIEQEVEKCPEAHAEDPSRSGAADGTGVRAESSRERIGFSVASRSRAIWDWCRWKTRAGIGDDSAISRNKETLYYVSAGGTGQVTVRSLPEWRSKYVHLTMRRGRKIAKVAWRENWRSPLLDDAPGWDYEQLKKFGSHSGQPDIAMV